MTQDTNECRLTGTIERIKPVATKSGAAMAEIILRVRRDRFRVVAHGNVAQHLLVAAGPDDRLSTTGTLSVSNWRDKTAGEWRNSFSVTAWACEIHGNKVSYQRREKPKMPGKEKSNRLGPGELQAQDGDFF